MPSPDAALPSDINLLIFTGRLLAKAIRDRLHVGISFPQSMIKYLLCRDQKPTINKNYIPNIKDFDLTNLLNNLSEIDHELYKSMCYILENDVSEFDEIFAITVNNLAQKCRSRSFLSNKNDENENEKEKLVELIPNGSNIAVTEKNKQLYVALVAKWETIDSIRLQLDAISIGFQSLLNPFLLNEFSIDEVSLLLSGEPLLNLKVLRKFTIYSGNFNSTCEIIKWFWSILKQKFL